jgi:hypothetical protein
MEFLFATIVADQYKPEDTYQAQQARVILRVTGAEIGDVLHPSMTACPDFFAETLIADELNALQRKTPNVRLENSLQQKLLAQKLLRVVLNKNKPLGRQQRLFALIAILFGNSLRLMLFGLFPSMLLVTLAALCFFPHSFLLRLSISQLPSASSQPTSTSISMVGLLLIVLGTTWYFVALRSIFNRRHFRLWSQLCKRLNIPDVIMHHVIGTYRFLRNKNRAFDYFESMFGRASQQ